MEDEAAGYYANFSVPHKLVLRMLKSRNMAAYSSLTHAGLAVFSRPLDSHWIGQEGALLERAAPSDRVMLLVVGGARTGTTFLTQVLASMLEVSWFPNLIGLFPRSPITATHRFESRVGPRAVGFESYYGMTRRLGGPNDGFPIWNRWLGDDRYIARVPEAEDARAEMRRFFDAWAASNERPLLNKNNRNLAVVSELAEVLPQAHFVATRREQLPTVASLLHARRLVHGDVTMPWGVFSQRTLAEADPLGYVDDVCHQVNRVDAEVNSLSTSLGDRIMVLSHESTAADPVAAATEIGNAVGVTVRSELPTMPAPRDPPRLGLTAEEGTRACDVLASLAKESTGDSPKAGDA